MTKISKKTDTIKLLNQTYRVEFAFKKMKNIRYRFLDNVLYISAPLRYAHDSEQVLKRLNENGRLIKIKKALPPPVIGNQIYIFGQLVAIDSIKCLSKFRQDEPYPTSLKNHLKTYLTKRVPEIAKMMNITQPYTIIVRDMKTRYGTNSRRTMRLAFTSRLVHYHQAIIDSVIIHELAHIYYFDHSKAFYQVVKTYCPAYYQYRKALLHQAYAL